jgi:hypothetical protein
MKRQCRYKKRDGKACRANATAPSRFCFFHDPDRAADRLQAQRAGGLRNKAVSLSADTPDCNLKNAGDVIALLGTTINQVRRGQVDQRVANSVGYLSGILLKALEVGALERRVADLEVAIKNNSQSSSRFGTEEFQFIQGSVDAQREATDAN